MNDVESYVRDPIVVWPTQRILQLHKALKLAGNTHTLEDILDLLAAGAMQSFVENDSWALTRLVTCPRKIVVEIFLVVGDDKDMPVLEDQVKRFARLHGATMIRAMGREGWIRRAPERGWKIGPRLYLCEV